MDIEKIKLIANLTVAKIEILKLKANPYVWQCETDESDKEQLEAALACIDEQLEQIDGLL